MARLIPGSKPIESELRCITPPFSNLKWMEDKKPLEPGIHKELCYQKASVSSNASPVTS